MTRFITTTGLVLLLGCTASAREQSLLARVTVYWASGGRGSDHYTRQHKCATGTRLRSGHCAVDPRKIPYGSQVIFPDRTSLVAVDTGSAVVSRKAARRGGHTAYEKGAIVVDRFFETKRQALSWARQNPSFMTVRVVPPNYRPQPTTQPGRQSQMVGNGALLANNHLANNQSRFAKAPLSLLKPGYRVP
ncbi:MAG TPA: 3D domain-containing protein [Chthoniobacterales bacterium]|nr:3D domain-containing protein [Chthoniobacterales bacterium]